MNATFLKVIALCSMLIDHIGTVFFPQVLIFSILGRLAFPIFCFFIAQGFAHTSHLKRYGLRLLVFAFLSEIPFDVALKGSWFYWKSQNVFFTLFLGLCALWFLEYTREKFPFLGLIGVAAISSLAQILHTDYGWYGVILIVFFYICRDNKLMLWIVFLLLNTGFHVWAHSAAQVYAAFALIPLSFYNGKRGAHPVPYFFYGFYPAHLLFLFGLKQLL